MTEDDQRPKILIIDDEAMINATIDAFLEDDYHVFSAVTGEQALVIINQVPMDLAIVDIRLPGISGHGFIKAAHSFNPKMEFLILTGSVNYELSEDLSIMNIAKEDVFIKPIDDLQRIKNRIEVKLGC